MNTRERFHEVMDFSPSVRSLKWEFGFWGSTIKRWYDEGLPEKHYPTIATRTITVNSSLYTFAWTHAWHSTRTLFEKTLGERERRIELPDGIAVWGGFPYWPSQGFPLDVDVAEHFGFDQTQVLVPVEQLFHPLYEPRILDEDERYLKYSDIDGITRVFQKGEAVIPTGMSWPIKDWHSWLEIKEQRMRLDNIRERFPANWSELVQDYKDRDYLLALGGYPCGFFGTLVHLLGYENLFYDYYDQPDLLQDILQHLTRLWLAIWEEVLAEVDVDLVHIWEDMSSNKGSMVSERVFEQFMMPYYKQVTSFLKARGVKTILVDTDGDCSALIPLFLECGVTGLYPMEVSAGMDVMKARKEYPTLQMCGGISKSELALGRERIDQLLEGTEWLLRQGGYIPFGDHFIPPEVGWHDYSYYREKLNRLIDHCGSR